MTTSDTAPATLPGPPQIDPDTLPPGDVLADTAPRPVPGVPGRYELTISDNYRIFYAFGGITMAFVDYIGELEYFAEEVMPRLAKKGLRPEAL